MATGMSCIHPTANLHTLPVDMIQHIVRFSTGTTIASAAQACKALHQILQPFSDAYHNDVLSKDMRRYFMPDACPAPEQGLYTRALKDLTYGDLKTVKEIMTRAIHTNFQGWSAKKLSDLFVASSGAGSLETIHLFIEKGLINQLTPAQLGKALQASVSAGRADVLLAMISTPGSRYNEITPGYLGQALAWAVECCRADIIRVMITTLGSRYNEITTADLGSAFINAASKGYTNIVLVLTSTPGSRYNQIQPRHLEEALTFATRHYYIDIVRTMIATEDSQINKVPKQQVAQHIRRARRLGYQDLAALLETLHQRLMPQ